MAPNLSDENLDIKLRELVRSERELLTEILKHLREIERRRLFSTFGYNSLFDYAVKRLGYSEDQAVRRISAMRLLRELSESHRLQIEKKIESGNLSLTNLSRAQTLLRQEKQALCTRTSNEKMELLSKLEFCSKREAEKVLQIEARVETSKQDQTFENLFRQLIQAANPQLQEKLSRLRDLKPDLSPQVLLEQVASLALEKWDPVQKAERQQTRRYAKLAKVLPAPEQVKQHQSIAPKSHPSKRVIPATVRHAVYLRDRGRCQICGSQRRIEIDHRKPWSHGGSNNVENLRLLCRPCNQRHAVETIGLSRMRSYLSERRLTYAH